MRRGLPLRLTVLFLLLVIPLALSSAAATVADRATLAGGTDGATGGGAVALAGPATPQAPGVVEEVREYLSRYYVDPLPEEKLGKSSVEELISGLHDPYTAYLSPKDYEEFLESLHGDFSGVGIRLEKVGDYIVVVAPIRGSPAERAGIKPGDRILAVDGHSLLGEPVEKATALIRGEAGTTVVLTIWREQQGRFEVKLVRERVHIPSAYWQLLPDGVGYIRVEDFGVKAGEEVRQAVAELLPKSKGLILDLRGNPGGLLDAAIEVAAIFVPAGPVVQVVERGEQPEILEGNGGGKLKLPLVVLVDRWTASAAEIVAGAIQDYRTGVLVGERTFGKGSVQSVFELSNGGALKLTVARYRTALGREVDKKGIEPDYWVAAREEQEAYARRLLAGGLRPGRTAMLTPASGAAGPFAFLIKEGRAYVSLDFFSLILGAFTDWKQDRGQVLVRYGPNEVLLETGAGGPARAFVEGNRVWLPVRLVVESLGGSVSWDGVKKLITVTF